MISFHRAIEKAPFLYPTTQNKNFNLEFFHASLRQGLFFFLTHPNVKGKWKVALVPNYVPEGIIAPLKEAGIQIVFYSMKPNLLLDIDELEKLQTQHHSDMIVYIHPFGLYLEENIKAIKKILKPDMLFLEDFAMSLPHNKTVVTGDLGLFSFTKILGVPEGGLVWIQNQIIKAELKSNHNQINFEKKIYSEFESKNLFEFILRKKLKANLSFENWIQTWKPATQFQTLVRFFLRHRINYYQHLRKNYFHIRQPISKSGLNNLTAVNLDQIFTRRLEIAKQYLKGLAPRYFLGPNEEAYYKQPLVGFPIQVDDQNLFHAYLAKRGVLGFRLTELWWFQSEVEKSELYTHHYLLPMNHYLTDNEIRKVIEVVNSYGI